MLSPMVRNAQGHPDEFGRQNRSLQATSKHMTHRATHATESETVKPTDGSPWDEPALTAVVDGELVLLPGLRSGKLHTTVDVHTVELVDALPNLVTSGHRLVLRLRGAEAAFLAKDNVLIVEGARISVRAAGSAVAKDDITGVQGSLAQMNLADVVQMLVLGKRDAVIEVRVKSTGTHADGFTGLGVIGVHAGCVRYARTDDGTEGASAFVQLSRCEHGSFRIKFGRTCPIENVHVDTMFLLIEAARENDEAATMPPGDALLADAALPATSSRPRMFAGFFEEAGVPVPAVTSLPPLPFRSMQLDDNWLDHDIECAMDGDVTVRGFSRSVP
jgi:Domain of unknown function (DUF4388)